MIYDIHKCWLLFVLFVAYNKVSPLLKAVLYLAKHHFLFTVQISHLPDKSAQVGCIASSSFWHQDNLQE